MKSETMKNITALDKLNKIASREPSGWFEQAKERERNQDWSEKSVKIALLILNEIKARKASQEMTQKSLAAKMGVSEQYVSKILKGQENLTLETITKIEKAMNIKLMEIPSAMEEKEVEFNPYLQFISTELKPVEMNLFPYLINYTSNMIYQPSVLFEPLPKNSFAQNLPNIHEIINRFQVNFFTQYLDVKAQYSNKEEQTELSESENIFA